MTRTITPVEICANPVLIIGAPRSGTTILSRSLARHSELWSSREFHFTSYFFRPSRLMHAYERSIARPADWLAAERVEPAELVAYLGMGVNALFTSRSEGKRWIDKASVNTMIVDVLAEMFPGALSLHILRDGRRVAHSLFSQDGDGVHAGRHPRDAADAITQLEEQRDRRGADFLVVPATERWWLAHYEGFHRHLERRYRLVFDEKATGVIYALGPG
jgi:Sulfotransferase family